MPLPDDAKAQWPPAGNSGLQKDQSEWGAWYSGDTQRISSVYAGSQTGPYNPNPRPSNTSWADRLRFWGRRGANAPANRMRLHVPVASDIASTSADLLFGDEPKILLPTGSTNPDAANPTQERFDILADQLGLYNILLEGAEVCAAIGGSYLRPWWDMEVADHPMLDVIHADQAVPEWRGDKLWAVTFWEIVKTDGQAVYRKLERHETGTKLIETGLYKGTADALGRSINLKELPETEAILPEVKLEGALAQFGLLPDYVPNVKPHRKYRSQPQGRADFAGTEGLMDSIDETYTSWMRDIRLGQARLVVSEDALSRGPRGAGASFDADQEIFTQLDLEPGQSTGMPIEVVQFQIRSEQHMQTALNLFERCVSSSGYSPQSFGLNIEGQAETGTALRAREKKTIQTRERKARYWVPAIVNSIEKLLAMDRELFKSGIEIVRPQVELADAIVNNPVEVASSISMFRAAQAYSIATAVKMAQPNLTQEQVEAEVKAIQSETQVAFDPTGGFE